MKKIIVVGAGGVGGFFGAKMSKAGYDLGFIARGPHKKAIEKHGLKIKSIDGDFIARPWVTDQYASLSEADLIVLAVKSWQLDELAKEMAPYLHQRAVILPLQNGADNTERLQRSLPGHRVLGGLCKIVSKIESPGIIDHFAYVPEIVYGSDDPNLKNELDELSEIFEKSGIKHLKSSSIQRHIWLKFLFIASISGLGALTRAVLGIMRDTPFLREKIRETAREIIALGQAKGVALDENDLKKTMKIIDANMYGTTMSMQRDIMEGRPSELENFNGFIVKESKRLGVPSPVNEWIYECLLPMEQAARKAKGL